MESPSPRPVIPSSACRADLDRRDRRVGGTDGTQCGVERVCIQPPDAKRVELPVGAEHERSTEFERPQCPSQTGGTRTVDSSWEEVHLNGRSRRPGDGVSGRRFLLQGSQTCIAAALAHGTTSDSPLAKRKAPRYAPAIPCPPSMMPACARLRNRRRHRRRTAIGPRPAGGSNADTRACAYRLAPARTPFPMTRGVSTPGRGQRH